MGLISGLVLLPLAPVRGVAWIAEVIAEEADRELAAANSPERALAELEAARATGEIDPDEADELESQLIARLLDERGQGGH
jgi:Gas vesicle protein G